MKLYTIDTGFFKLDGGAMFGVVPKTIWNKLNPADNNNLCTWAMRCLLVEEGNRLVLIDCGLGTKQSEKFLSYYEPFGDDSLEKSLRKNGFRPEDITDVFLTHLHFDHCGGAIKMDANGKFIPAFQNAIYWSHAEHWEWATNPNSREKASFLKENILPVKESGQLKMLGDGEEIFPGFSNITVYGHTEAMMLPKITTKNNTLIYCADLLPSAGHLPISYVMAYDVRPLITLVEKENFMKQAMANNWLLFFEHDKSIEACSLIQTERGVRMNQEIKVSEL